VFKVAEKRNAELIQRIARAIPPPGDERRIADYYSAFLDQKGIEQRGLAPLKGELDSIAAIADRSALSAEARRQHARRHRSLERDQLPHRESVRPVRDPGR
jgi:predicted metalloendopeptidase